MKTGATGISYTVNIFLEFNIANAVTLLYCYTTQCQGMDQLDMVDAFAVCYELMCSDLNGSVMAFKLGYCCYFSHHIVCCNV